MTPHDTLEMYLAQYSSLRAEQQKRLDAQQQAFQFLVGSLTAVLTATTAVLGLIVPLILSNDPTKIDPNKIAALIERISNLLPQAALFLPIILAPLAFIFFDNEIMIFKIGADVSKVRDRIFSLVGENESNMDLDTFCDLTRVSRGAHFAVSIGRWIVFLVPIMLPMFYALSAWESWIVLNWVVFSLDAILVIFLLWAVISAIVEQWRWRWPEGRRC